MARRLAAILAADVAGYSRLMAEDEAGTLAALKAHRRDLFDPETARHGGRIVKLMGDGVLVEFPSVVDAVECALAIQRALAGEDGKIKLRIGINLGDVIIDGDDIYGDGVNVAARLEAVAEPGGIAISGMVHEGLGNRVEVDFSDAGEHQVKNMARPIRVFRWAGSTILRPSAAGGPALALPDKPSIAVLPFTNMSGDPEQEFLAEGISEDIITALSQVRWLFVIARNSTFSYKGTSPDVRQVSRDLGVRYVLEGSVRKGGNRIRITAQLIEATTGRHVWADRYDRDLGDVFALQDEITETLMAAIEPELGKVERERAIRKPPETLDAWTTFQRGLWHHYKFTKEENAQAQALFRKAIELDPNFSRALSALAHARYWDTLFGYSASPEEALNEALELARKAISLDDKEPFAHFALGRVQTLKGDLETAIAELEESIELNPSFAHAYYGLGFALILAGRPEDAVPTIDKAIRLNPHDPSIWTFMGGRSVALLVLERHEEALHWAMKSVRQANAGWLIYAILAAVLGHLGRAEEARRAGGEALRLKPDFSASFIARTLPFQNAAHLDHFICGLRKAGLPE
jgi:adenylate cyclase